MANQTPKWWHPFGLCTTLQARSDGITIEFKGGRSEQRMVDLLLTRPAVDKARITWRVWTSDGSHVCGNTGDLTDEELRLMFALRKPRGYVRGRYFCRQGPYLTIPAPGSTNDCDLTASLLVDKVTTEVIGHVLQNGHESEEEELWNEHEH